jgi:hypothetical protein
MISTLALAFLLAAGPIIATDSDCPSARDIGSYLSVLLPGELSQSGAVNVTTVPDGLVVELRPEDPEFGAQRSLAVVGTCEERARAAAVVIATWWPTKPTRTQAPTPEASTVAKPVATQKHAYQLALVSGVFASVVSGSTAPGLRVEALWFRWSSVIGPRLAVSGTGQHGGALGEGQAHFRRAAVEFGVAYVGRSLSLDAGALASLFWIEGSGFNENQKATGFAAGATAGVRVGWSFRRLQPWLGLRGILWPQSQRTYVLQPSTHTETSRPIPHWELQLGAGIALSLL